MNKYYALNDSMRSSLWKFPVHIDFEITTNYLYQLRSIDYSKTITFDLSETEIVHSSFIGFMIDLKEKILRSGGIFEVRLSPQLIKHFSRMNIYDHFIPQAIPEAI
ncbi:MAG TPA: hypothetical protein PK926_06950 [Spirochaetota bacterium]|nr:hypothetical protein [Spirochaetota bacterium]HPI90884.1 hypothetical protein [Spirochaetota bacterium]HPR48106.1 hypothetical protein [Spirochaetota bacterium]